MKEIKLFWSSVKNELDAETYKAAIANTDENAGEKRAEMQTSMEVLDENWCRRRVDNAVMKMSEELSKYVGSVVRHEDTPTPENENKLKKAVGYWSIGMKDRNDYDVISAGALTTMMHAYVVSSVLAEWFAKSVPQLAQSYRAAADESVSRMLIGLIGTPRKVKRVTTVIEDETTVTYE